MARPHAPRSCSPGKRPTTAPVSRARQPIPPLQAALVVLGMIAFELARRHTHLPSTTQLLAVSLLVEFVLQPISTLVHELGHAAAAVRRGPGTATIMVGRGPWINITLGRVKVHFSPLPTRGVLIRGVCHFDNPTLSWRARAAIALAGPAATLAELLASAALAILLWPTAGTMLRTLLVSVLVALSSSLVVNLAPRRARGEPGGRRASNDGTQALFALRMQRAGEPLPLPPHWVPADPDRREAFEAELREALQPPRPGEDPARRRRLEAQLRAALTPPAEAERRHVHLAEQRDAERAFASVPPPPPRPT